MNLRGVYHFGLTVVDVERSAQLYERVVGFSEAGRLGDPHDERRKIFLRHDGMPVRLGLPRKRNALKPGAAEAGRAGIAVAD